MDLAELSRRTGLERRKLRYVLDHKLVPSLRIEIVDNEVGRPRYFADDVGVGIVCAARLLDAGLPHEAIKRFLTGLLEIKFPGDKVPALVHVLKGKDPAQADFGDSDRVRLLINGDHDSGWFAPGKRSRAVTKFSPKVTVSLDLGLIRDEVFSVPQK